MAIPNFLRIFNFSTKNLSLSALILAFFTFLSALLGIVRDRLLASFFGAGRELDIYAAAFRIPDLVYNLLIAGGLAIAFLPIFSDYFNKDKEEAWKITSNVLNIFLIFLIGLCLIFFIFAPWLVEFVVPGFSFQDKREVVNLTRILLLSPIFFGAANVFVGILQYFQKFFVLGIAPVLYNIGIILGIVFLAPKMGVFGVGLGVVLGAFFYFLIQFLSGFSCGFSWKPLFNLKDFASKTVFRLMVPRIIATTAQQINLWVITAIASTISSGAIAIFYFSNNLQGLVVSLIGLSFASATFPLLAKALSEQNQEEFLKSFSNSFRQIFFFAIPLSFLVFLLKTNLVRLILHSGSFDEEAVKLTVWALGVFAISIFAQAENPLLVRTFFSLKEGKKPAEIALISSVLNAILAVVFIKLDWFRVKDINSFPVVGLVLAFSLSAIFQFILLLFFLRKKIGKAVFLEIWQSFKKIVLASSLMFIFATFSFRAQLNLTFQTILVGLVGGLAYLTTSYFLKSQELEYFIKSINGYLKKNAT